MIVDKASELIVKIKEPQAAEYHLLEPRHTLFAYLHLAPDMPLVDCLLATKITAIAYETVENEQGKLPLLAPMSEVAGKLATQVGAHYLETAPADEGLMKGLNAYQGKSTYAEVAEAQGRESTKAFLRGEAI